MLAIRRSNWLGLACLILSTAGTVCEAGAPSVILAAPAVLLKLRALVSCFIFILILMTEPKLAFCSGWHQNAVSSTGVHRAMHFILPTIVMDFFEIETCHCPKWRALLKFTAEWWDQTGRTVTRAMVYASPCSCQIDVCTCIHSCHVWMRSLPTAFNGSLFEGIFMSMRSHNLLERSLFVACI